MDAVGLRGDLSICRAKKPDVYGVNDSRIIACTDSTYTDKTDAEIFKKGFSRDQRFSNSTGSASRLSVVTV